MIRRPPRSTLFPYTTLFRSVLADVAFEIQAGEIIGIIGPNGAGKTTLLEVLAGILPAETSDVQWLGRPLDRKSTRLNSSHANISYAVFCLKKKKKKHVE